MALTATPESRRLCCRLVVASLAGTVSAMASPMTPQEMRRRASAFAQRVSLLARPLFKVRAAEEAASQLTRAAASAAQHYRAACLARSHAEFRAKIGAALEECDESVFWLEYLRDAQLSTDTDLAPLIVEGDELVRILGASKRTSLRRALAQSRTPARQ